MDKLFRIGEMAKLFHMSMSTLRHYENIGLLKPEMVDQKNGYRYYSVRQFEALNTVRYLRALDMPLSEIEDFLQNREVDAIEAKLRQQKEEVAARRRELERIERKIDNRLRQLQEASSAELDRIVVRTLPACRMVWMQENLHIHSSLDMEAPIRRLEGEQDEASVFLGKVGVSISAERLEQGRFDRYDGMFLLLDEEDSYQGQTLSLPEEVGLTVRFRGSHTEAPEQYRRLAAFWQEKGWKPGGFSREITMIDYGITNDLDKFVTEISVPVRR